MKKFTNSIEKAIEECMQVKNNNGCFQSEIKLNDDANTVILGYWEPYGNSCNPEYKVIVIYIYQYGDRKVKYTIEESKTKY